MSGSDDEKDNDDFGPDLENNNDNQGAIIPSTKSDYGSISNIATSENEPTTVSWKKFLFAVLLTGGFDAYLVVTNGLMAYFDDDDSAKYAKGLMYSSALGALGDFIFISLLFTSSNIIAKSNESGFKKAAGQFLAIVSLFGIALSALGKFSDTLISSEYINNDVDNDKNHMEEALKISNAAGGLTAMFWTGVAGVAGFEKGNDLGKQQAQNEDDNKQLIKK